MIDTTSLENAVEEYLKLVINNKNDQTCLVWNSDTNAYEDWVIRDVENNIYSFGCTENRLTMWLTPDEAEHIYKQHQQRLKV